MTTGTIVILVILGLNFIGTTILHGKPKDEEHNSFRALVNTVIWILLLWWAGNFG